MNIEVLFADYTNQQHANDIVELLDMYAQDPMGGGVPLTEFVKQNLTTELSKTPHAFSVISYVNDEPAGLINCFEAFSTFRCQPLINIHDIVVADKFRRLGVCQKMLACVESRARETGCCKITLEVLEGNTGAQKSYIKFGFDGYELDASMGKALFWQKNL